jgi:hypothetical protein
VGWHWPEQAPGSRIAKTRNLGARPMARSVHYGWRVKLAYFHTNTVLSSWTFWGAATVMRRMGHEVLDAPIPTNAHGAVIKNMTRDEFAEHARKLPTVNDLSGCDKIIVVGPEYVAPWITTLYGERWRQLSPDRSAVFLESTARADAQLPIEKVGADYTFCYYPDPSDVARFGGFLHRASVDTEKFCPDSNTPKLYDAAFVGTLYPKRVAFLQQLATHLDSTFLVGDVHAHDIGGECQELWTSLYVRNIRQMRIHAALPSNNPMPVSRPYETLACGTFLIESCRLPEPLEDKVHYRRYDASDPASLAELIRYYLAHEQEREAMARAGCEMVRKAFPSEKLWQEILTRA